MTTFVWDARFTTGVEIMDAQHRKIFDCMTRIYNEMSDNHRTCDSCDGMLSQLELFCRLHFLEEERLMDEMAYPSTAEHKHRHDLFLVAIDRFRIENNQCHAPGVLNEFIDLGEDFIAHMLNETVVLGDFVHGNAREDSAVAAH
jgi:hemerythrin